MPEPTASIPAAPALLDRALGAYLGFAIGDALGATVEFFVYESPKVLMLLMLVVTPCMVVS